MTPESAVSAPPRPVPDLEHCTAQEVIAWALQEIHPQLALACSFQKEETVVIDMLLAQEPAARVFTIDTGVLFPETLATWREIEERYGLAVEVHDARPPAGPPWSAQRCCGEAKVAALESALAGLDGWVTGLRREQSPTRAQTAKVEWDARRGVWKVNPLADWTEKDVWGYITERGLSYHPLHDHGYESIGCAPCTRPGSGREGRWAGAEKTECGLHVTSSGPPA
jgi:phosphoadenosine phosphosulfate reductase